MSLWAVLAAVLAAPTAVAQAEITWRDSYYNPSPAEGDLVLPMPCGGAMTFRPIETPSGDGAIGDVAVILGQEGDDLPYLTGLRRSFVSGAFPGADGGFEKTVFYMAKYEIAEAQYAAVMSDSCPDTPRRRGFVPAVERSKLDFERFAEAYTVWLMTEAPGSLPQAGDVQAYVRLPTEDEWEFAARGGLSVEPSEFRAPYPPLPEGTQLNEYVAHGGTDSAGGRVQVIGTLNPNPLGLHDMLGNAAEIVATPFALVRHGRLHGQAGGYVKRGGDARTPLESMNNATRFEVSPYDAISKVPTVDRYTGARLVISSLSITSPDQSDALIADLDRLAQVDPELANAQSEEEAIEIVQALASEAVTPNLRRQLEIVEETILRGRAERNAQRDKSIRLILESGTLMCSQTVQRYLNALAIQAILPSYDEFEAEARNTGDDALLAEVEAARSEAMDNLARLEARAEAEIVEYANLVEGLAGDYSTDLLSRQSGRIRADVAEKGNRRAACLDYLGTHLATRAAAGFADLELIAADFQGIAIEEAQ